jgi:hypothetical protein
MPMINHPDAIDDWWWGVDIAHLVDRARAAIHMLHEQAHGEVPYLTCSDEPCRSLPLDIRGPAPRVLP